MKGWGLRQDHAWEPCTTGGANEAWLVWVKGNKTPLGVADVRSVVAVRASDPAQTARP
jgi:hypothetical protein